MPRRSIAEFRPTDRWLGDDPFYIRADIVQILKHAPELPPGNVTHKRWCKNAAGFMHQVQDQVPRAVALVERLESAAKAYHAHGGMQTSPTAAQFEAFYRNVEEKAAALLEALGAPTGDPDQLPAALSIRPRIYRGGHFFGGPPSVDALKAVVRLRRWAKGGVAWAKERPKLPSHETDEALDVFIVCLSGIWRDIFSRDPGSGSVHRDKDGNRRGGPFAKFVLAALKPLRACVPTEAEISDRIRKLHDGGKLGA